MGVRELVGDANGVPASEKVKKHCSKQTKRICTFYSCNNTGKTGVIKNEKKRNIENVLTKKAM